MMKTYAHAGIMLGTIVGTVIGTTLGSIMAHRDYRAAHPKVYYTAPPKPSNIPSYCPQALADDNMYRESLMKSGWYDMVKKKCEQ